MSHFPRTGLIRPPPDRRPCGALGGDEGPVTRRGALLLRLADLAARQAEALRELAELEGATMGEPPKPPAPHPRPRARPGRVGCPVPPPPLTALDAQAAEIVTKKLRLAR